MQAPPPPVPIRQMAAGTLLTAGYGYSQILPSMDFETYCEAGFIWSEARGEWVGPRGAGKSKTKGLTTVGTAAYSEHPTCEILCMAYDLKDGKGPRQWKPGNAPPFDLFKHIAAGGLLESHKADFEAWIWRNICVKRLGWPPLPIRQQRCSMAKARAHALPGALDNLGAVLQLDVRKDADGKRLLNKFSVPRNPTKAKPQRRIRPEDDPEDAQRLYGYNIRDIQVEGEASARMPDLNPFEQELWFVDQTVNARGVAVNLFAADCCATIIEQAYARYDGELQILTGGAVTRASELQKLKDWLYAAHRVTLVDADAEAITAMLERDIPAAARRALEIRQLVGAASVKKLYAILNQATAAGRIHDLFMYHAARTGRFTGAEAQPQNLPRGGPDVYHCAALGCGRWFGAHRIDCPWCGAVMPPPVHKDHKKQEWNPDAIPDALAVIASRDLATVELFFGNAVKLVSGLLRGLFVAAPGHELISSDFKAIEAVVTACIAGEDWRIEVFRTHGLIYETSASRVIGMTLDDFTQYKTDNGKHHPMRQSVGKCLELACGYGGWITATKATNIRMDRFFNDEEIKGHILGYRSASPKIVEMWGGQERGSWGNKHREYFGLEGMAVSAVLNPGHRYTFKADHPAAVPITYFVYGDVLYCELPSGRLLTYHEPLLERSDREWAGDTLSLSFMGWNSNPQMGPIGWVRMRTYGGKLTENVVQAVARDILVYSLVALERAGYPIVMHVHDEIVAEVIEGAGSIEEFETIMSALPAWCATWPVSAEGGWRGMFYRKAG